MPIIEYEWVSEYITVVFLDRKRVGKIRKVDNGYKYFPLGANVGGELFNTLEECKQSLERE